MLYKYVLSSCYIGNSGRRRTQSYDTMWYVWFGLALCLPSAMSSVFMVATCIYVFNFVCLHPSLYLLVSLAWWDWPLTWLTNHRPSVLWRTVEKTDKRKIVPEMTYNVSSGTLNPTIPYLFIYHTIRLTESQFSTTPNKKHVVQGTVELTPRPTAGCYHLANSFGWSQSIACWFSLFATVIVVTRFSVMLSTITVTNKVTNRDDQNTTSAAVAGR